MIPFKQMTGIVLAGGRSSRFGTQKAFAELHGVPLVERVLDVLKPLFKELLVVTKTPELFCPGRARIVRDITALPLTTGRSLPPLEGPLVGLYSGLLASSSPKHFVCACDMPFLTPEIVAHVCRTTGREDIVIPRVGRYWEPLCAMYSKRCLPVVRELLMRGERGLMPLARRCRSKVIAIQGRPRPQRLEQALRDVDTPTDLARAKRLTEVR